MVVRKCSVYSSLLTRGCVDAVPTEHWRQVKCNDGKRPRDYDASCGSSLGEFFVIHRVFQRMDSKEMICFQKSIRIGMDRVGRGEKKSMWTEMGILQLRGKYLKHCQS